MLPRACCPSLSTLSFVARHALATAASLPLNFGWHVPRSSCLDASRSQCSGRCARARRSALYHVPELHRSISLIFSGL
ncbi:uncharacterized protein B0H18DRAFT_1080593, partial [Fomitopsis serialis]|uniref:uncharacterized protein n=1 Tax=Fomitopsis serialis TaxID=139415 RepID=UPI002007C109